MSGASALMAAMGGIPGLLASALADPFTSDGGTSSLQLSNNGTFQASTLQTGNWVRPATASIAALYQVKADVMSGSLDSGTTGIWLDLSTSRTWAVFEPSDNTTKVCVLNVSIREKLTQKVRKVYSVTLTAEDTILD